MAKKQWLFFLIPISAILFIAFIIILFAPDMSTTLINTVPEYPPELNSADAGSSLISDAVAIDKTNVKSIIAALNRPSEYYSETKSTITHSKGSIDYTRKRWTKGPLSRVDIIASSGAISKHYIYNSESAFIWRPGSRTYYKTSKGSFDADEDQMLMTYEDILSTDDENIITAQFSVYDSHPSIYVETKIPSEGYTERYWISASTGLLLFGQTLDESGNVIYSISAVQTDTSPQNSDIFKLPDGTLPPE